MPTVSVLPILSVVWVRRIVPQEGEVAAMKYAVLGAAGQLGRDLCPRLEGEVLPLTRADADLTRPDQLRATLETLRPDMVINCAAYNFVDRAEAEPDAAFAVNAWGVRQLADLCAARDWTLVHFSTDYVFGLDAGRTTPYAESDAPGPVSVYGLSKLAGEYLARARAPRHFVIRTCGLYGVWGSGGKGGNFVETMLRKAGEGKPWTVVNDQVCTPSYTVDVATATVALLRTRRYGLYHLTSGGSCTWYELARAVFELAHSEAGLALLSAGEYRAPARRPVYSVLEPAGLRQAGVAPPRAWREALAAYLQERQRK
jgi:dTDP-4-dehydrorhamnose reductase